MTLAQAVLKGDKMDDVVRDATMMGVPAIEPLVTEHTAVKLQAPGAPTPGAVAADRDRVRQAVPARVGSAD